MTHLSTVVTEASAPVGLIAGFPASVALAMAAEAIIDNHRYVDDTDRVLARYEDVPALFPSCEELQHMGVNVIALADALEGGLNAQAFGLVLSNGLDIEGLNQALTAGIDIPTFNEGLAHLVEIAHEDALFGDDFVSRVLARHGE
jgi:hypothetical protein